MLSLRVSLTAGPMRQRERKDLTLDYAFRWVPSLGLAGEDAYYTHPHNRTTGNKLGDGEARKGEPKEQTSFLVELGREFGSGLWVTAPQVWGIYALGRRSSLAPYYRVVKPFCRLSKVQLCQSSNASTTQFKLHATEILGGDKRLHTFSTQPPR